MIIYILSGRSNRKKKLEYYTGESTRDLGKRLADHLAGRSSRFGRNHHDIHMVFFEEINTTQTLWFPVTVSKQKGNKLLEKLFKLCHQSAKLFR